MDAYKTPEADLATSKAPVFKPVKAILYGLSVSIILAFIVGIIESVLFGIVMGVDMADEGAFSSALASSTAFLAGDTILSALVLYFAGKVVAKHVPGKEIKYGMILTILTLAIYLPIFVATDSYSIYPIWYNLIAFVVIVLAIYLGAISRVRT